MFDPAPENQLPSAIEGRSGRIPASDWAVLRWTILVVAVLSAAALVWSLADVLLLAFAAMLLAVALRGLAAVTATRTGISEGIALASVIVILFAGTAAVLWLFGAQLSAQFSELLQALPGALQGARHWIQQQSWGSWVLKEVRRFGSDGPGLVTSITGVLGTTLGVLSEVALVLASGVYFAIRPKPYLRGILYLVPKGSTARMERLFRTVGRALSLWLVGQAIAMVTIGTLTGIGVWMLGLPSALALGVIAGATEFIPVLGPILGAVPAVLIGFSISPIKAVYVALFYFVLQQFESNLLMPLIQQRVVALPPVLTLFGTLVAGLLFGVPGVLLATPLAVATVIAIQIVYVEGVLGKRIEVLGEQAGLDGPER
jgi:predicted PurR-regulated permease PerM